MRRRISPARYRQLEQEAQQNANFYNSSNGPTVDEVFAGFNDAGVFVGKSPNVSPNLCECGHAEASHADIDYDHDGEGFVRCRRPCEICDCTDFWRP